VTIIMGPPGAGPTCPQAVVQQGRWRLTSRLRKAVLKGSLAAAEPRVCAPSLVR
jgi:hypothetical protein